jgi:serine/threonine protein kinase
MALAIGTQLGSHEITALLGKGGMGEVYRARDLKLKRDVAIKILPEEFSRDADRVSRFQREAEVLASLNHTNIAAIHDFEETTGTRYLVLELVEGETLMAVSIRTDPDFQVFQTSPLFTMPEMTLQPLALGHRYAVRADGQHFLVAPAPTASARVADSTPITVIVNWTPALHKK